MKKILLLIVAFGVFTLACGEAGFESDVSKTSSIDFDIAVAGLNGTVNEINEGITFNFADADFDSYVSDVEKFTLNSLEFELSEVVGTTNSNLNIEIRIDLNNNTADANDGDALLSLSSIPITNTTDPIVLYSTDSDNPGLANGTIVRALEQAILDRRTLEIEITASKAGTDLTDDFVFTFLFDLTARLQLD